MGDKGILNKSKKMIDKVLIIRYYNQADCETEMFQNKKIKKVLQSELGCGIVNKLSLRDKCNGQQRTLITEQ